MDIDIQERPRERSTWLTVMYVTVFLLATTIQAVHLCGLEIPNLQVTAHARTASFSGGACLTCLMAHSPAVVARVIVLSPLSRLNRGVALPQIPVRQVLEPSHLYIRPPPAC